MTENSNATQIKRVAQKLMPSAACQYAATVWHLRGCFGWCFRNLIDRGWPNKLLHFGIAPGDDLLCTAVLRELRKRGFKKLWMMSDHFNLFQGNDDVDQTVPVDHRFKDYISIFGAKWQFLEYSPVDLVEDRSRPPQRHIIAELCYCAGIRGQVVLRPYFSLQDGERSAFAWAKEKIAIQSSGLAGRFQMKNKQWYPERFQQVVDSLKGRFQFIQIGSATDPALDGVTDLRGKTSIRETAAVLGNCRLYIGNVGFLMHMARAVECPAVIIYGGREAPWQSGYSCNINLYSALSCSPCWLWNKCDYDRICMKNISAQEVVNAVEQMAARSQSTLLEDKCEI